MPCPNRPFPSAAGQAAGGDQVPAGPVLAVLLALAAAAAPAGADFSHPDCPDIDPSEFRYERLISRASDSTLDEPVRIAMDYRGGGKSDIYFAERHGRIKKYDAETGRIHVLGELDVFSDAPDKLPYASEAETGINGLALDPGFKENRRIWVFYSPWEDSVFRLSRFALRDVDPPALDMEGETVVLEIPEGRKHAGATITIPGGPIAFDAYGDLWIAVGANSEQFPSVDERYRKRSAEASSSNLADLRGSILRIHPDGSPRGYSIPEGNLGAYWSAEFARQGRGGLADEYADTSKVRPEIYIKGTRNPYSMSVDPVTRWLTWGEFGPNRDRVEELNLANRPIFSGYPYWAGKNIFVLADVQPWGSAGMDPEAPVNNSVWNEGPRELPPAEPALIAYSNDGNGFQVGNHPISGPIYRYDGDLDSPVKLPPHFDGSWFSVDRWSGVRIFKVNGRGDGYTDSMALATDTRFTRPVDLKQGPDGAIYVVDYAGYHSTTAQTHIGRIEYTGSCRPGVTIAAAPGSRPAPRVRITPRSIAVDEPGPHRLSVRTPHGRLIRTLRGDGPAVHPLALPQGGRGVYLITLEPGRATWAVPRL